MSKEKKQQFQVPDDYRLRTTDYVVTDADYHGLWQEWHWKYGVNFEQDSRGHMSTIGHVDGRPICVTVFWYLVGGKPGKHDDGFRVAIVEGTSQLVDHKMIDEWAEAVFPCVKLGYRKTNGTNFGNLIGDMSDRLEKAGKGRIKMRDYRGIEEAIESVPIK